MTESPAKKTADELEAAGKRLQTSGKFVPKVHRECDIRIWVKLQMPFVKSEHYKEDQRW